MSQDKQTDIEIKTDEHADKIISMWQYFIDCISSKYCSFKGRANRKEYWGFTLFYYLLSIAVFSVITVIEETSGSNTFYKAVNYIWGFAFLLPWLGVKVRRLHDINYSGWWLGGFYLLIFSLAIFSIIDAFLHYNGVVNERNFLKTIIISVWGIAVIAFAVFLYIVPFIRGSKEKNKYGEVPEGKDIKTSTVLIFLLVPIIGVFSIGVISGYSVAMSRYKTNKIIDEVVYITINTKSLFHSSPNYITLYNGDNVEQIMASAKIHKNPTGNLYNNFVGGNIYLRPSDKKVKNDNEAFVLTFDGLSEDICKNIVTLDWARYSQGFIGMHVFNRENTDSVASDTVIDDITIDSTTNINEGIITAGNANQAILQAEETGKLCSCNNHNTCAITWKYY